MIIKLQIREGFWTTNWKAPVEVDTEKYPELAGMNREEATEYIIQNSESMPSDPNKPEEGSLWEEMECGDIENTREKNYDSEVVLYE